MYFITEKQINLIGRRLNAGSPIQKSESERPDLGILHEYAIEEGLKIEQAQTEKGLAWLMNLWKTPAGKERKNNPYGYREQDVLEHFDHFEYCGHYDRGNAYHSWYAPLYRVVAKDGESFGSFEYFVQGGEIQIVG